MNRGLTLRLSLSIFAASASTCLAGMTTYGLSDIYKLRIEDTSFFIFLVIACSFLFKLLWNYFAKGFTVIPRINYRRSLCLVIILGLAMLIVLTMISGIREVLTPEAWRHQGTGYRLNDPAQEPTRLRSIEQLRAVLFDYARSHGGKFPLSDFITDIPDKLWEAPDEKGTHYLYSGGLTTNESTAILAVEPVVFGDKRFVLYASGTIEKLSATEINSHQKTLK